jgi:adenylosuccinate synthase
MTLEEEISDLEQHGIDVRSNLKIAYNCHIITPQHVEEDRATDKIGSTKRGIMPTYRDKYARVGVRAESVTTLQGFLCDPIELLRGNIMIEGAQGFGLCPDHGDYPYVTSSPPTSAYALHSLGIPPQAVRKVWGAAKVYETYVGTKQFQPRDDVFKQVARYGEEYGATTGRSRQVNWIDIGSLVRAVRANGVTDIVFSKIDVLQI